MSIRFVAFPASLLVVALLSACGGNAAPADDGVAPAALETEGLAPPAESVVAPLADSMSKRVVADGVPFQPHAATVEGDALASTGMAGFVMFGPYEPLAAGSYRVQVTGSAPAVSEAATVIFDVTSGQGAQVHGRQVVQVPATDSGFLADFTFDLPQDATDLEVRAQAQENALVRIESYEISKAE